MGQENETQMGCRARSLIRGSLIFRAMGSRASLTAGGAGKMPNPATGSERRCRPSFAVQLTGHWRQTMIWAMSTKSYRLFYWTLLLAGVALGVGHAVRIYMETERFRYMSFFGPMMMCGLSCYQLYCVLRVRRDTAGI
jgi:hypothetical protein